MRLSDDVRLCAVGHVTPDCPDNLYKALLSTSAGTNLVNERNEIIAGVNYS